ncbi:MAG: site-specific integrase [Lachnospiraceae bacterium]|nr:site-specific integrase [Lachnospiraceae bacterium]
MPVYKDENRGTWYCSFYYTDWQGNRKKKKKEGFKLKREAQDFEKEFVKQYAGSCDMAFKSFVELYMEDCKTRLKQTTYKGKSFLIDSKITPYFGDMPLNSITPANIRQWQNSLMNSDNNYSPTYLKTVNNQLSAIFNFAVRYYNLKNNPVQICGSMGQKHADSMEFWTLEEFKKFIKAVENKHTSKVIFELLFWTGIRSGEMLALTLNDFDFENMTLSINKNYARLDKEDLILSPKTAKGKRIISIMPFLADMIKGYAECKYCYEPHERLFEVTKFYLTHEMIRGCKHAGVKKIRVHDLRHSHASMLIELGYSPLLISERLGHENIETTLRTYSHLYPNKQKDLAEQLEKLNEQKM